MPPFGSRTATLQPEGDFIITPSITACPPICFVCINACLPNKKGLEDTGRPALTLKIYLLLGVFLLELLNSSFGVDQLLLAREKGMALRADVHAYRLERRASSEGFSAGAHYLRLGVVGVYLLFQRWPPPVQVESI